VLKSCFKLLRYGLLPEDVPIIVDRTVWNFSTPQIADINCEVTVTLTHARNLPISREKDYAQDM